MDVAVRFLEDERGATAIEYGLIAALMALALIVSMTLLGNSLIALFEYVRDEAVDAMNG